jgi:hypothetical protein
VNTITETMDDARRYTSKRPQPGDEEVIVGTIALTLIGVYCLKMPRG